MASLLERVRMFAATPGGLAIAVVLPLLALFSPLLSGRWILSDEPFFQHLGVYAFYQRAIQGGDSVLWNPENFSGFPSFVGFYGFFSPTLWLAFRALPLVEAFNWSLAFHVLAAAFLVALLLRRMGVSSLGACLGAFAHAITSIVYTNALILSGTVVAIPLLFVAFQHLGRSRHWRALALAAAAVAWVWLSAGHQYMVYAVLASMAFVPFVAWQEAASDLRANRRRVFATAALLCVLAFMIGTAIGLVQLLPSAAYARLSVRSGGLAYADAIIDPLLPTDAIRYLLPYFRLPLGVPFGSSGAEPFLYLGAIPLFFAMAGFRQASPYARFFRWLFIAAVLLAVIYSPLFWLTSKLPVLSYFRSPSRWMMVGSFAAAMLVGFGVDLARASIRAPWLVRLSGWFSAAAGLVFLGAAAFTGALTFGSDAILRLLGWAARSFGSGAGPPDLARRYLEALDGVISLRHADVALPVAFLLLAALLIRNLANGRLSGFRASVWLAAASATNVVVVGLLYFSLIPAGIISDPPSSIRFLQSREGRAIALLPDLAIDEALAASSPHTALDEAELEAALLFGNTNLLYGVSGASTFEQIRSADMARLLSLLGDPHAGRSDVRDFASRSEQIKLIASRHDLFDFLGIRWVVSRWPVASPEFREAGRVTVSRLSTPLIIYENPTARPLAYAVPEAQFVSAPEVFNAFSRANFAGTFAACAGGCEPQRRVYAEGRVSARRVGNAEIAIETEFAAPGFIVISQNNLPGWRASIGGRPVAIATINTVYQGIAVPAGSSMIVLRYHYPCGPSSALHCLGLR